MSKPLNEYQFRTHPIGSDPLSPDSTPDKWRTDIVQNIPVRSTDLPQGGRRVGFIEWDRAEGGEPGTEIWDVRVDEEHQRQGLATEALRHSQRVAQASRGAIPMPLHSPDRTEDGEAWARSLGDPLPRRRD